jgi:hypothetical protein
MRRRGLARSYLEGMRFSVALLVCATLIAVCGEDDDEAAQ